MRRHTPGSGMEFAYESHLMLECVESIISVSISECIEDSECLMSGYGNTAAALIPSLNSISPLHARMRYLRSGDRSHTLLSCIIHSMESIYEASLLLISLVSTFLISYPSTGFGKNYSDRGRRDYLLEIG